jgi:hypothetical protein
MIHGLVAQPDFEIAAPAPHFESSLLGEFLQ